MLNMPTVTKTPAKPPEKPDFIVNKGNFKGFFRDMFMTFHKVLPPMANNLQCNLWRTWQGTQGVHVNITWQTIIKLVSGDDAAVFHKSLTTTEVINRLLDLFPVLAVHYTFEQTRDKMESIIINKTNAPLTPIAPFSITTIPTRTEDSDLTSVTDCNKQGTYPPVQESSIEVLDVNYFKIL